MNVKKSSPWFFLVALLCLLALVGVIFLQGGGQAKQESAESRAGSGLIEVTADSSTGSVGIDQQALKVIQEIPGVATVYPWYQETLTLAEPETWPSADNPGNIPATPWLPELAPTIVAGEVPETGPGLGEIILPHSVLGGTTDNLVGREIQVAVQREVAPGRGELVNIPMKVIATADNSDIGVAGLQPSYVSYDTLKNLMGSPGPKTYSFVYVKAEGESKIQSIQNALNQKRFKVTIP